MGADTNTDTDTLILRNSELRNSELRHAVDYSENSGSGIAELRTSGSALQKKGTSSWILYMKKMSCHLSSLLVM
jgi:hypothetical protein